MKKALLILVTFINTSVFCNVISFDPVTGIVKVDKFGSNEFSQSNRPKPKIQDAFHENKNPYGSARSLGSDLLRPKILR